MRTGTGWMAGLVAVAMGFVVTGCALGVAGARVSLATPFSKPNFSYDSVGVAQKNDRAAGATFSGAPGTAAKADGETLTGSADQIVQVGGDASNARSTDASLADEQSQAAGRNTGSVTDSGTKTQDKRFTPTVNVGPAGGAQLGLGTGGGAGDPTALTDEQAAALLARLRQAQAKADAAAGAAGGGSGQ